MVHSPMKPRWIFSLLLAGLFLLCTIPAVQADDYAPDESTNLTNEAILLIHNGSTDYEKAIALIDRAFAVNSPNFANRVYGLELKSYAQIQLGNYTGALATIDQGLAIEETAVLWNNRGYVSYLQGDYAGAVKAYDRVLEIDPAYTVALLNKGNALMELQKYNDAIDAYTLAFAADKEVNTLSHSQRVKTWNNMGKAYYNLGNYSGSAAAYKNALVVEPGNETAASGLAMAEQQAQTGTYVTIAAVIAVVIICCIAVLYLVKKKPAAPGKKKTGKPGK